MSKFASTQILISRFVWKKDKLEQNKSPLQLLTIIFGKFRLNSSRCRISDSHEIGFMGWALRKKTKSTSVGKQHSITCRSTIRYWWLGLGISGWG